MFSMPPSFLRNILPSNFFPKAASCTAPQDPKLPQEEAMVLRFEEAPYEDTEDDWFSSPDEDDEGLIFDESFMKLLGKGGFGACYKTVRVSDGMEIAVKVTYPWDDDGHKEDAFRNERDFYETMAANGQQPTWLPAYLGSGVWRRKYYIALELLDVNLLQFKPKDLASFKQCAIGALGAVKAMHAAGYLHRDVKLENFAVRRHPAGNEGEEGAAPGLKADDVVLIDFGLSRKYDLRSVNEKEYFSGTREYASERQLLDKPLGPADDVESLGYALLDLWRGEQWWEREENSRDDVPKAYVKRKEMPVKRQPPPSRVYKPQNKRHRGGERPASNQEPTIMDAGARKAEVFEVKLALRHPNTSQPQEKSRHDEAQSLGTSTNAAALHRRQLEWRKLDKQAGQIPNFIHSWMEYCKSLGPHDCPDYELLRGLIEGVQGHPLLRHVSATAHQPKQPAYASHVEE